MPAAGRRLVAQTLGITETDITIHLTRGGRRLRPAADNDYMVEAAAIAKQVPACR